MAFACVLPGPSGDDSHPGVRVWPYRHPSLCGGVNNGDVSATAVSLCRLQQALKRDPHAGDLFYVPWAPGQPRFRLMLVTLFRGNAVDEARRPDCWLVIEAEIDHAGPGPMVASRGDRMGRRLVFGSYRIDAAQQ